MYSSEAPLIRLLASQAQRRGFHRLKVWALLSGLLFLVPTGVAAAMGEAGSMEARWFVATFAVALAVLVPAGQLFGDAALLSSLRRGRCLEEVVGTLTQAREIVDQVATFSVSSVLRIGLAVAAPLLVGCLIAVDPGERLEVLLATVAWFPAAAALALVGSYTLQAAAVWSHKGETGLAATLLTVLGAAVLLVGWNSPAVLGFGAGALLALGIGARWLAMRGLDRACEPPPAAPRRSAARGWSVLRENPIALREACRRRTGLPLGRHWIYVGGLGLLVAWAASGLPGAPEVAVMVAGVFAFVQPLFASSDTAKALLLEREGSSMEALACTGLEPRAFVDGWAAAAWFPRLLETLLVLLVAGAVAAFGGDSGIQAPGLLLHLPDALLRIVFGAYLGLAVAGFAKARRDMGMLLFASWIGSSIALSMVTGILMAVVAVGLSSVGMLMVPSYMFLGVGVTVSATAVLRFVALSRIRARFEPQR